MDSSRSASGVVAATALLLLVLVIVVVGSIGGFQPQDAGGIHIGIVR
jgi:hypothetical protein